MRWLGAKSVLVRGRAREFVETTLGVLWLWLRALVLRLSLVLPWRVLADFYVIRRRAQQRAAEDYSDAGGWSGLTSMDDSANGSCKIIER